MANDTRLDLTQNFPNQNCPFPWGYGPPSNTWFHEPTRVLNPNGISIRSAVFAGLTSVTGRYTSPVTSTFDSTATRIMLNSYGRFSRRSVYESVAPVQLIVTAVSLISSPPATTFLCPSSMWNAEITRYCIGRCLLINRQLQRSPFARARGVDSTWICSVRGSPRLFYVNRRRGRPTLTQLLHCTTTSSRAPSTTSSRHALLFVAHDHRTRAAKRLTRRLIELGYRQLLVALLLRPAVQLLHRRPSLLRRLDNYGTTSDVLIANYVIGCVLRFGRTSSRQRPVHATCGPLSTDCWVVDIVLATVSLPMTYPPSSLKR